MSSKPNDVPRWADNAPPERIVEPPSAFLDVGWSPGGRPEAEVVNWWQNLAYQWFEYLDDGDLEVTNVRLVETIGDTNHLNIALPSGWHAAASDSATILGPPQAQVFADAELSIQTSGTWTPTRSVTGGTTTVADGWYQRNGNLVTVIFRIDWTGATPGGNLAIGGLPFAVATSVRGDSIPTGDPLVGQVLDGAVPAVRFPALDGTNVLFYTTAGALATGPAAASLAGSFTYPTDP
jgi:hypothetical protein